MADDERERPQIPIQSAFQMEVDRQNWLVKVESFRAKYAGDVLKIMAQGGNWLSELLNWIGEQGLENLSPCLVASKAAGMQEAWDKAQERAA